DRGTKEEATPLRAAFPDQKPVLDATVKDRGRGRGRGRLQRGSLARKNHAKAEATSSLRARKLLNRRCASVLRACFKINESKQTVFKFYSPKIACLVRDDAGAAYVEQRLSRPLETFDWCHRVHRVGAFSS